MIPSWSVDHFALHALFVFDQAIPFTRDSWRGRIRACRGIGAQLSPEAIAAFDQEHDLLLRTMGPEQFEVLHRIDAHIFKANENNVRE